LDRKYQYIEKIDYIIDSITVLPRDLSKPFMKDALYYRLQSGIDTMTNLVKMLCADLNIQMINDATNIEKLLKYEILDSQLCIDLISTIEIRDMLVRQNGNLDEQVIIENVPMIYEALDTFIDDVQLLMSDILD
jgi:uncharacterized protein YutE (UPF0331/DUF86 family)